MTVTLTQFTNSLGIDTMMNMTFAVSLVAATIAKYLYTSVASIDIILEEAQFRVFNPESE